MIKICSVVVPFPEVDSDYVVEKNYSIQILSFLINFFHKNFFQLRFLHLVFSSALSLFFFALSARFHLLSILQHPQKLMQLLPRSLPVYRIFSRSFQLPIVEYIFPSRTVLQLILYFDYIYSRSLA